jgi:uncharacterized damage-inducible protein DinB
MVPEVTSIRLRDQLTTLEAFFSQTGPEAWQRKPASGKWSALENLAHLGRYHEIFLDRVRRILNEDRPHFARYRAEDDEEWRSWSSLQARVVQSRIRELRSEVIGLVSALTEAQLKRTGFHPILGEMTILQWLEFFLLHEAHHLYAILFRLKEAASP